MFDFPSMGPDAFKQIFVVMYDEFVIARQVIHAPQVGIPTILHQQIKCIKVLQETCKDGGSVSLDLGGICYLCRRKFITVLKDEVHQMDIII